MAKKDEPTPRPRQYYVLRDHKEKGIGSWKEGKVVLVDPRVAVPYVGANILTPLPTAINTKLIPPVDPEAAKATEQNNKKRGQFTANVEPEVPATPQKTGKKTLATNSLRDAVQAKKEANPKEESKEEENKKEESEKSTDDKSSKIEETETKDKKNESSEELSDAEKAIQEKIASLKKDK